MVYTVKRDMMLKKLKKERKKKKKRKIQEKTKTKPNKNNNNYRNTETQLKTQKINKSKFFMRPKPASPKPSDE